LGKKGGLSLPQEKLLRAQVLNIVNTHLFENPDTHTVHCSYVVTYADENGKVGESLIFTDEDEAPPAIGHIFYL